MLMQTSQLRDVKPKTHVGGFSVQIEKQEGSIVADTTYEDLVTDYYYYVTVVCDGTHALFSEAGYFTVCISQLICSCDYTFMADYPVIMLKQYEQITKIEVRRETIESLTGVWLQIYVFNHKASTEYAYSYLFRKE